MTRSPVPPSPLALCSKLLQSGAIDDIHIANRISQWARCAERPKIYIAMNSYIRKVCNAGLSPRSKVRQIKHHEIEAYSANQPQFGQGRE
jgi:hypothetical protein